MAIVPAPLDVAFVLVHCAALLVAVSAVGYLALRATQSVPMATAAQLIALWGPLSPDLFFHNGSPLDLYASFGSDALAVALMLAGLAIVVAGPADTGRWRWIGIAATTTLAAAILTRYAMAGAVAGLLIGLVLARVRSGDRRWPWAAVAIAVAVGWQLLVYPLLVDDAGPKSLVFHRGDIAPLGTTMAGWFGIAVTGVLGCRDPPRRRHRPRRPRRAGPTGRRGRPLRLAAAGQLAIVVVARQYLDAGLNLREERHVLLVRFVAAILIVTGLTNVIRWVMARRGADDAGRAVALGAIGIVVLAAATAGGWPIPEPLIPERPTLAVEPWIDDHGLPGRLERQRHLVPADRRCRRRCPAPGRGVDRAGSRRASRGRGARRHRARIVQAYRPSPFVDVDLRTLPCAVVGDTWSGAESTASSLAVIDVSSCA